jgi:hypothetical protein
MRNLDKLVGEVITIKSSTGLEFIGILAEIEEQIIAVSNPRAITLTQTGEVSIMPYTLTADNTLVDINLTTLLTVTKSMDQTALDYKNMLLEDKSAEE